MAEAHTTGAGVIDLDAYRTTRRTARSSRNQAATEEEAEPWIRYPAVAEHYDVSRRTVERWVAAGCPSEGWDGTMRIFRLSDVDRWLDDRPAHPEARSRPRRAAVGHSAEPWVRYQHVAEHFSVSVRTVERWVAAGCPARSLGGQAIRLRLSEVHRWLWLQLESG